MVEGTSNNTKVKVIIALIVIVLTAIVGVSFAYFSINVEGNEEASSLATITADLKLTFTDGPEINISDIYPGWSTTKTFSVTNNGTDTAYYDIKMYDVFSTFVRDDMVYTLTSTNGGGSKTETILPNNDGLIKAKISIPTGVTQIFTMTIRFKELNDPQDYNQGASYRGIIQVISPYTYTNGLTAQDITLRERILLDNTEAYPDNVRSKYVTGSSGISYTNPSDYAYIKDDYYIYEQTVNFTSSSSSSSTKKSLGSDFTFDSSSGLFKLSGGSTGNVYSSTSVGKFTCNINSSTCYGNPQEVYKILEVSGSTVTKVERYISKPNRSSWNGLGLYQTSTNTRGGEPTYFFRGHVVNNYVKFAGDTWRIIRINEDGSVRLIRQSSYASAKFFSSRDKRKYVGFSYGTDDDPYSNGNNSTIKTSTESYYNAKLTSYASYLADVGFCGDRSLYTPSSTGGKYYHMPYNRLVTNKRPRFMCPEESNDLYTTTSSSIGNNALTYPVGLITADEMVYAGGVNAKLSKFYLDISTGFWSISPAYFSSYAYVFYSYTGGVISTTSTSGSAYSVRPVINLKADVVTLGGSGSATDPYIITQ